MNVAIDDRAAGQTNEALAHVPPGAEAGMGDLPPPSATHADEGLLTPYQRRKIAAGNGHELTLGPYHILDELGKGAFGQVFKAEHSLMKRVVALKVIIPERANAQHWLLREVQAATRLTHPNIALAYDANMIDGVFYFAMEYVDGPNLETLVAQRGPLPVPFVCTLMRQTALAFQCAHANGMVHRDIKPANLLLVQGAAEKLLGSFWTLSDLSAVLVKVVDFGLARLYPKGSSASCTIERDVGFFGTPAYIAPEQALNVHDADIRSDMYSLGCSMYFALAGRPPFTGANIAEVLAQHRERQPKSLDLIRPDVPVALIGIINQLLAKNPKQRFQTPDELLETLAYAQVACFPRGGSAAEDSTTVLTESAPCLHTARPAQGTRVGLPVPEGEDAHGREGKVVAGEIATPLSSKETPVPIELPASKRAPGESRRFWQQWREVVATLAKNLPCPLGTEEYKVLHRTLLLAVRSERAGPDLVGRDLLARLETLVEPWLSLNILQGLDPRTRMDLWQSCRQIDRELMPGPTRVGLWPLAIAVVGCSVLSFLFFFLARLLQNRFFP